MSGNDPQSPVTMTGDTLCAAIVTVDREGVVRYANSAFARMFGRSTDTIVGHNVAMLVDAADPPVQVDDARQPGSDDEARVIGLGPNAFGRRADGSIFPLHATFEEIEADGFAGYIGVLADQRALGLSEARITAAVDVLSEGFALFDETARLVLANERYRAILALPAEAMVPGTPFDSHVASIAVSDGPLARGALDGPAGGHMRYTFAGDQVVDVRLTRLQSGDAIIGLRDLSREAAEALALSRAERFQALGELTGGVAHDFNNLLVVIIGNLELLERRLDHPDTRALAREALDAAEIGARVTDRLLAFSCRQHLTAEQVDINSTIRELATILERTLGAQIALVFELGEDVRTILVDRGALETALINLATNAADAMPRGGQLTVATDRVWRNDNDLHDLPPGPYVRIRVTDTGVGMPPDVMNRVFEPFFTTKPKGRGSGLGLSSLYGFAKQSGGTVTVASTPDEGTQFALYLPAQAETVAEPVGLLAGKTVLVVDDDPQVRRLSMRHMRELGAHVLSAANGTDALAVAQSADRIDVLFSDVVMPGGADGAELAARLRQRWPELPVVLTTGFSSSASAAVRDYPLLRKPFREADLANAVLRAMQTAPTAITHGDGGTR